MCPGGNRVCCAGRSCSPFYSWWTCPPPGLQNRKETWDNIRWNLLKWVSFWTSFNICQGFGKLTFWCTFLISFSLLLYVAHVLLTLHSSSLIRSCLGLNLRLKPILKGHRLSHCESMRVWHKANNCIVTLHSIYIQFCILNRLEIKMNTESS